MGAPFVFRRPVRFDEIDAAGFVYYPRLIALAHEAVERLLAAAMPGGYASLVVGRRIGLPWVHVEADFAAPLRFGDELEVSLSVTAFGASSVTFGVDVGRQGGITCALLTYVVACVDLEGPSKRTLLPELRAAFEPHQSG
ncbi:MAG: hypothetical protein NVS3B10_23450 [Polyangiales bacterium]